MASINEDSASQLPSNLSSLALERFDQLNASGKLIYGSSPPPEIVEHEGFTFQFSIPPALSTKPILPPSDPSRSKPGGPFVDPDPDFVLCKVAPHHTLELNKHCILRPMYILHTTEYEKQAEDLDDGDFEAVWTVMNILNEENEEDGQEIMAIYNCGAEAGASQGHKHVQMFPKPPPSEFTFIPDTKNPEMNMSQEGQLSIRAYPKLPYWHACCQLNAGGTAEQLYKPYAGLMKHIRPVLQENGTEDYNMVLTKNWMMLIPRRHHGRDGVEANAVGMLGMVWVKSKKEREGWTEFGMTEHLKWLGVPAGPAGEN